MSNPSKVLKILSSVKPTRMWIDGKCFNIGKVDKDKRNEEDKSISPPKEDCITELLDKYEHFNITRLDENQFSTSFRLPTVYYEKLAQFPNFTVKDLENHTNTNIQVPECGTDGSVIVTGKNVEDVAEARSKLQSVFSIIRDRHYALQFIAIPVFSEEVKTNFQKFKEEIINGDMVHGMHESIFQKPEKLHLTVSVFALLDDIEKSEAMKALEECKADVLDPLISKTGPLKIKVSGIDCMNNEHSKVNILYANARIMEDNTEHTLQKIVNSISHHFNERGLVRQFQENVKLHVTLINTKYRKVEGRKRKWADKKMTFDARTIMQKYKDYHFGESCFETVHLSLISSVGDDGFYKPLSIINI